MMTQPSGEGLNLMLNEHMERLIIDTSCLSADELLSHWRWLVPSSFQVLFATTLGDLFLRSESGQVYWLDVGSAEMTWVAETESEFDSALHDQANSDYWLGPKLVNACEAAGMERGPVDCFSYLMLPILGGSFDVSNFKVRPLIQHLAGWGPLCKAVADLPDGMTVNLKIAK